MYKKNEKNKYKHKVFTTCMVMMMMRHATVETYVSKCNEPTNIFHAIFHDIKSMKRSIKRTIQSKQFIHAHTQQQQQQRWWHKKCDGDDHGSWSIQLANISIFFNLFKQKKKKKNKNVYNLLFDTLYGWYGMMYQPASQPLCDIVTFFRLWSICLWSSKLKSIVDENN